MRQHELHWVPGTFKFPSSLQFSPNASIEAILTDVPLFAVGLLSFGVFTFFFMMQKVNRLSLFLYMSVFLSFVSAIFDISQLLVRGTFEVEADTGLNEVTALIIIRELGFAFSAGFLYLFFWEFVAERPYGEGGSNASLMSEESHSGRWRRWGLIGHVLKFATLGLVVLITILQIVWRLVQGAHTSGGIVYILDSILEVILSIVFILKIFLNMSITPVEPRRRVLLYYLTPILALIIGAIISAVNLSIFAFSESTVGRVLQSAEMYMLLVFLLTSSFYHLRGQERRPVILDLGISSEMCAKVHQEEKSDPYSPQPRVMVTSVPPNIQNVSTNLVVSNPAPVHVSRMSRGSMPSRLSSWLRGVRSPESESQVRPWDHGELEKGNTAMPPSGIDAAVDIKRSGEPQVHQEEPSVPWNNMAQVYLPSDDKNGMNQQQMSPVVDIRPEDSASMRSPIQDIPASEEGTSRQSPSIWPSSTPEPETAADIVQPYITVTRQSSNQSHRSIAGPVAPPSRQQHLNPPYTRMQFSPEPAEAALPSTLPSNDVDYSMLTVPTSARRTSPVFGLNGVVPLPEDGELTPPLTWQRQYDDTTSSVDTTSRNTYNSANPSLSTIGELFRQQKELDKSIAMLKLISNPSITETKDSEARDSIIDMDEALRQFRSRSLISSGSGGTKEHTSVKSDFSLSNFPTPPWAPKELMLKSAASQETFKQETFRLQQSSLQVTSTLPVRREGSRAFFESSGRSYDVTSFIGNYAQPSSTARGRITQIISEDGQEFDIVAAVENAPPASASTNNVLPASASSGVHSGKGHPWYPEGSTNPSLPPMPQENIDAPSQTVPVSAARTHVDEPTSPPVAPLSPRSWTGRPRRLNGRPAIGLPAGPRLGPSGPGKPRPPPLVLNRS